MVRWWVNVAKGVLYKFRILIFSLYISLHKVKRKDLLFYHPVYFSVTNVVFAFLSNFSAQ